MEEKDLMTRNYDLSMVEEDPRFTAARKNFVVILGIIAATVIAMAVVIFLINWGPVENYKLIMGIPTWFFLSGLISIVGTAASVAYVVKMKDVPMDETIEEV